MDLMQCPNCKTNVAPMASGECPACRTKPTWHKSIVDEGPLVSAPIAGQDPSRTERHPIIRPNPLVTALLYLLWLAPGFILGTLCITTSREYAGGFYIWWGLIHMLACCVMMIESKLPAGFWVAVWFAPLLIVIGIGGALNPFAVPTIEKSVIETDEQRINREARHSTLIDDLEAEERAARSILQPTIDRRPTGE